MKPFINGFEKLKGYAWVYKLAWKVDYAKLLSSGRYEIRIIAEGTNHSFMVHLYPNKLFVYNRDATQNGSYDLGREMYLTRDRFTNYLKEILKSHIDKTI
jgi:CRISPR/Cas system-associated protein Cas5 (RAMP superfamily)